jgi:WD40 repeat protein
MFRALDWSHDGKYVLVQKNDAVWYLTRPERELQPLIETNGVVRGAQFSPDGRWVAYASNESGSMEVYVSPFPSMTSKWQVSSRGGEEPRWPQDGSELFYLSPDGELMAVKVTAASSFEASSPVVLFQAHRRQPVSSFDLFSYAVSGDGNRFLIATKVEDAKPAPLSVFLNWTAAIEK